MTVAVNVTINGVQWANALQDSINIQAYRGRTISTVNCTLYDKNNLLAIPQEGVDIQITRGDVSTETIFGGLTSIKIRAIALVARFSASR